MGFKAYNWCGHIVYLQKTSKIGRIKLFFDNLWVVKKKYGSFRFESGI